jgi:hypothetical protein
MSEHARGIRQEAIRPWAEGLHYNKAVFSEILVYYDDEAVYFETRGDNSSIVRFTFEMLKTLAKVIEEESGQEAPSEGR